MNILEETKTALSGLNVPVTFQEYTGDAETYITFFEYNEQAEEYSEDDLEIQGHDIQVDIWSKSNYKILEQQVKTAMKSNGFLYTNGQDLYESETKIYHKGLRFYKPEYLVEEIISI